MRAVSPCATVLRRFAMMLGLFIFATLPGCSESTPQAKAGFDLVPGQGWQKVPNSQAVVPGAIVSVWSSPEGASLAVYTSLPIPGPNADALRQELATRMLNLPGVSVESSTVETYSGLKAARVEIIGPGMGYALAPSGIGKALTPEGKSLLPTRRIDVYFPRQADTLCLTWHFPDSARAALTPQVEATLQSIQVADPVGKLSSY